ncbi:unnamed protein product, partial [marine sediment metagenome]
ITRINILIAHFDFSFKFWYRFKHALDNVYCLPSFEVNDINKVIEKLKILDREIVFPLTKIGDNWVLEFKDTEGNDIEVYSKINNM